MMTAIFATMSLALIAGRWGPWRLAVALVLLCLALSAGEFLYEIYSPENGFRMPWLQVLLDTAVPARSGPNA